MVGVSPYPPAPWRLAGPFVAVAAPIPAARARALVPEPVALRTLAGRALGCVLAVDYRDGAPLRYREAASLVGPVTAPGRVRPAGGWVHTMVVDHPESRAGGRHMWGVPKRLAGFDWHEDAGETSVTVHDEQGAALLHARWRTPRRPLPLPAALAFFGALGGPLRSGTMRGRARVAPARVALEIPDASPLAQLGLRSGRRLGVAGSIDVRATAPRDAGTTVPALEAVLP